MRPSGYALAALAISWTVVACGGGGPSSPKVSIGATKVALGEQAAGAKGEAQKAVLPTVRPKMIAPGPALPPLSYEAKGRRDPFVPLVLAKEKVGLEVNTVKLVGIIDGQQLLALVEAPDGLGYIVKPGDVLGNGHVTDVTASSITFAVSGPPGQSGTSLTLRLPKE